MLSDEQIQWIRQNHIIGTSSTTDPTESFDVAGTQCGFESRPSAYSVITVLAERGGLELEPTHGVNSAATTAAATTTKGGDKCKGKFGAATGGRK